VKGVTKLPVGSSVCCCPGRELRIERREDNAFIGLNEMEFIPFIEVVVIDYSSR
jgi:hypothetical protein